MKPEEISPVYASLKASRGGSRVSRWEVGEAYTRRYFPVMQPFPEAPLDDLGTELRAIFGEKLTRMEPRDSTLEVGATLSHREMEAFATALVKLSQRRETRVEFSSVLVAEGALDLEVALRVYTRNPYGERPSGSEPIVHGSFAKAITPRIDNVICLCGADHVIFHAPKSYPGQGRKDHPFLCLACGRYELVALGVPEQAPYEIHLKQSLPVHRRMRASSYVIRPGKLGNTPLFVVMGIAALAATLVTVILVNW